LKEENKGQAIEWKQEIKADMEQLIKGRGIETGPIQETMRDGLQRILIESESALDQFKLAMDSCLRQVPATQSLDGLKEGMDKFQDQMKKVTEDIATLSEKIKEGFTGIKDELGSMIKFSYSDLEKKLAALEARVKALEKMVLP